MPKRTPTKKAKMKNNTVVYLIKEQGSATLKRVALADYFGEAEMTALPSGKPVITKPQGYYVSISHSGGVAGMVISPVPVGLDIEKVSERDVTRLKRSFLSDKEKKELEKSSFFEIWVRKEASAKLSGEGIFSKRKKDASDFYTSLSREVSDFSGSPFSAVLASEKPLLYTVKEL